MDRQNIWVNGALRQFTQWIEDTDGPISGDGYKRFVELLREQDGLPQVIRTYLYTVSYTSQRKLSLPTVITLLNLAAYQGTAIQTILCEPSFAASPNLAEGRLEFEGLLFRPRNLRENHRQIAVVLDDLMRGEGLIPPASVVWLEFGLWVDGARDDCPLEQRRYVDKFMRQKISISRQRFRAGVNRCMRLLGKISKVSASQEYLRHFLMTECGHDRMGADECAEASINLRRAIAASSRDRVALHEDKKACALASWARGEGAALTPTASEGASAPSAASRERGR